MYHQLFEKVFVQDINNWFYLLCIYPISS